MTRWFEHPVGTGWHIMLAAPGCNLVNILINKTIFKDPFEDGITGGPAYEYELMIFDPVTEKVAIKPLKVQQGEFKWLRVPDPENAIYDRNDEGEIV